NERPLFAILGKVKSDLFDYVLEELDQSKTDGGIMREALKDVDVDKYR
nr:hypothetical protein [Tanacetum cinerariifolium]